VAQAVEAEEALDPVGVTVSGAGREMADTAGATVAVEQARRVGEGQLEGGPSQDVVVEESERGVGLFQAVEGIGLGLGDVGEEAADVAGGQVARVALVGEEDEAAGPVGEALAGPVLAEARLRHLTDEVEQFRRLGRGPGRRGGWGHGSTPGEAKRPG
jgi:hypothetical protein